MNSNGSYNSLQTQLSSFGTNSPNSPFPNMPSQTFITLVESQFELLSNCLVHSKTPDSSNIGAGTDAGAGMDIATKVQSMALYLPQENQFTGQLEFIPAIIYPSPRTERVFIANDAETGLPPTIPRTLTKLPGFAHAQTLLPTYPFASRTGGGSDDLSVCVGEVEEVMCDPAGCTNGSVLSIPLFHGPRTVGVLLTWPTPPPIEETGDQNDTESFAPFSPPWTQADADQIKRAAYSLGVALQMDGERSASQSQAAHLHAAIADNLHQIKNPLQALRTFGKLLQRKIALEEQLFDQVDYNAYGNDNDIPAYMKIKQNNENNGAGVTNTAMILAIAENMLVQSDRVVDLIKPMDSLLLAAEASWNHALEQKKQRQKLPSSSPKMISFSREHVSPPPLMSTEYSRNSTINYSVNADTAPAKGYGSTANSITSFTRNSNFTEIELSKPKSESSLPLPPSQPNIGDLSTEIAFFPDVIYSILSAGEAIATEKNIKFELETNDDLPGVLLSAKHVQEAVSNIIDNALKYVILGKPKAETNTEINQEHHRNPDPKIQVILTTNPKSFKAGVSIIIADNGPGIPQDQWERVFQRGCRGDLYVANQVDGTGIGLDVSQSLVSAMGGVLEIMNRDAIGDIGLASKILDGAVFRIMLFRDP